MAVHRIPGSTPSPSELESAAPWSTGFQGGVKLVFHLTQRWLGIFKSRPFQTCSLKFYLPGSLSQEAVKDGLPDHRRTGDCTHKRGDPGATTKFHTQGQYSLDRDNSSDTEAVITQFCGREPLFKPKESRPRIISGCAQLAPAMCCEPPVYGPFTPTPWISGRRSLCR